MLQVLFCINQITHKTHPPAFSYNAIGSWSLPPSAHWASVTCCPYMMPVFLIPPVGIVSLICYILFYALLLYLPSYFHHAISKYCKTAPIPYCCASHKNRYAYFSSVYVSQTYFLTFSTHTTFLPPLYIVAIKYFLGDTPLCMP